MAKKLKKPAVQTKQKEKVDAKPKEKKERKDPRVEEVYEEIVEYMCPVRGLVKQLVKIKRFKSLVHDPKHTLSTDSKIDKLDAEDDGLSLYGEDEVLE